MRPRTPCVTSTPASVAAAVHVEIGKDARVGERQRRPWPGLLGDEPAVLDSVLVPQVDRDGNDLGGLRDPEVAVPLATTTGWNFRDPSVGNPEDIYQLLGSYIPLARTRAARQATADPRLSIDERYRGVDDYLHRVQRSAMDLIRRRYLLAEDLDGILERARTHWSFATRRNAFIAAADHTLSAVVVCASFAPH